MVRLPKLNRLGIPLKILSGNSYKYKSVANLYKARLIQELMRKVNAAFWAKAKGGTDDLGNKWKPLAPSTHAYKPLSPIEKNTFEIKGKRERGLLTPAQNRLWSAIYARKLARYEKRGESNPEKKAAEEAWGILKARGAQTIISLNRVTDINIRTGRLVVSTKPGTVSNNRYYSPKDQQVTVTPQSIRISLLVPYIDNVDSVRPVIPEDISSWIIEAHDVAILEAKVLYDSIQSRTPDRRKANKRRKPRRNR